MTNEDLMNLLDSLLAQWENEVVEFKRAGRGFSTGEAYSSASRSH